MLCLQAPHTDVEACSERIAAGFSLPVGNGRMVYAAIGGRLDRLRDVELELCWL